MTPEEFERRKEEEKKHLRQLRALKQQHREAQRKAGLLGALRGLTNPESEATHDEMLDRLTNDNIMSEARFEVAMENAGLDEAAAARRAQAEADAEATRKAEAEALVRQMKAQLGDTATSPAASEGPAPAPGRTIGPVPPPAPPPASDAPEAAAPPAPQGPKSIGRPRSDA